MVRIASNNNIDEYDDLVSKFNSKCIGDVVPTASIKTSPNQKPWIDGSIRAKLNAQTTAFNLLVTGGSIFTSGLNANSTACYSSPEDKICILLVDLDRKH